MATFEKIASVDVGVGGQASIDFTVIPSTYTDLVLNMSVRTSKSAVNENMFISLNGFSTNFSARWFYGGGSSGVGDSTTARIAGFGNGNTATANAFGVTTIYFPNYTSSANKSYSSDTALETNATTTYLGLIAGLWSDTSTINRITITAETSSNILQYSTATLYGIKKA